MPSFYQDRLGTNIGKTLKTEWRFCRLRSESYQRSDVTSAGLTPLGEEEEEEAEEEEDEAGAPQSEPEPQQEAVYDDLDRIEAEVLGQDDSRGGSLLPH